MKKEFPGLKLSQYKEKLFKEVFKFLIITYSGRNIQTTHLTNSIESGDLINISAEL